MRNNGPVTQKEVLLQPGQKLISSTDLRGIIVHCNDAFAEISGFSREELIGQNHNLVRHPDMPAEAFALLWKTLKSGHPWMGLVKNRCKNGDHYWVSAYITPVTEKGKVVGYESVRSCPDRADVKRAEQLYSQLKANKKSVSLPAFSFELVLLATAFLLTALLTVTLGPLAGVVAQSVFLIVSVVLLYTRNSRAFESLKASLNGMFMHPLATATYTSTKGPRAQLYTGILSLRAHLDAVLTRMEDASGQVARYCNQGFTLSKEAIEEITHQHAQTSQVATAMQQMTAAINDISHNVQETAATADRARDLATQGREVALSSQASMRNLSQQVQSINDSVVHLAEQIGAISAAAEVIEQVAEQTNLLALNAAIEAARAGDHGRGFSVVADEVRQLATSTRESTDKIRAIVSNLEDQAKNSVAVAGTGTTTAEESVVKVAEAESMLGAIADAVESISGMATQMATAVEQQSHVAEDVNSQIERIADLANSSKDKTYQAGESIKQSQEVSDDLHELVMRFRQQ